MFSRKINQKLPADPHQLSHSHENNVEFCLDLIDDGQNYIQHFAPHLFNLPHQRHRSSSQSPQSGCPLFPIHPIKVSFSNNQTPYFAFLTTANSVYVARASAHNVWDYHLTVLNSANSVWRACAEKHIRESGRLTTSISTSQACD